MNWKFLIKKTLHEVQNVGLRPFIVSIMIEQGFKKGNAVNLESGTEVEIILQGEREKVENFRKKLVNAIKREAENFYSELPKEFEITEVEEKHGNNNALIGLSDKASSLTLSQTSKGVAVMVQGFSGMSNNMKEGFGGISNKFEG
ncbi:MAG: acylphosphatase, partial [Candidatus Diapherotrites archaeon]|nr:acylphosphatase [Candidatus Diapherotrites archaeon]